MTATNQRLRPQDLLADSPELGSPPLVYRRLVEVINHPRGGAGDVANVIREDTALTARLLKLVNSAFFAFPKKIETVSQAVSVVGTSQVRDLALATSVTDLFKGIPAELLDVEDFWKHSLGVGVTARVLAGLRNEANVERFFVTGILHDVGRLVLLMRAPEATADVIAKARTGRALLFETEREVLGFDHALMGGVLMDHWKMPEALREAVRLHHDPRRAERYPMEAATVHVADLMATALQLGSSGERLVPPLSAGAWAKLGIDPGVIGFAVEDIDRQYSAAVHLLGLSPED
ncbi:MAG: HDOD domain-containing protein [Gemmatimonadetes bacterium]|nr:HDOD domain-containing protein [Gemmatimonadota bacterium]